MITDAWVSLWADIPWAEFFKYLRDEGEMEDLLSKLLDHPKSVEYKMIESHLGEQGLEIKEIDI